MGVSDGGGRAGVRVSHDLAPRSQLDVRFTRKVVGEASGDSWGPKGNYTGIHWRLQF